MPEQRVHAVVRTLAGVLVHARDLAPSASAGDLGSNAEDDGSTRRRSGRCAGRAGERPGAAQPLSGLRRTRQPAHGTATCSALGACFYKADAGFTGSDSVHLHGQQRRAAQTDTATVYGQRHHAPRHRTPLAARDDEVATLQNKPLEIKPLANDTGTGIERT